MSNTLSNMLPLGIKAPNFELLDTVSQQLKTLKFLKGQHGTVILFICNHCPFVLHINAMLVKIANQYQVKGIHFVAISSNDVVNYPQDDPELMHQQALKLKYPFPYLYDETQDVAKAYQAACTPDIFLFDEKLRLAYRGQLDDSRPRNGIPVTGKDLVLAMDSLLNGEEVSKIQKPSIGCNIKWK